MGARHDGRIIAVQTLYRYEISRAPLAELLDYSWIGRERRRRMLPATLEFASLLVAGCLENLTTVDREIRSNLEHWDMERVSRVDLSVLRLGTYCLLFQREIPAKVTIHESVAAARELGGDSSYRFVNGVLDSIHRQVAPAAGPMAAQA